MKRIRCFAWIAAIFLMFGAVSPAAANALPIQIDPKLPIIKIDPDLLNLSVTIKDPGFSAYVHKLLGKAPDQLLYKSDFDGYCKAEAAKPALRYMSFDKQEGDPVIQSVDGIELFSGCNYDNLYLINHQITDITPIGKLTTLKKLFLDHNSISDLSPLSGLTQLKTLRIVDNEVADLTPVSKLAVLTELGAADNRITDISPIAPLTLLEWLDLGKNRISDLSPLHKMTQLNSLWLSKNNISDISPLDKLRNMQTLDLDNNQIGDLTALGDMSKLIRLSFSNNHVSDLAPLAALYDLEELKASQNNISELKPLRALTKLSTLIAGSNHIESIEALNGMTLQVVHLDDNAIDLTLDHNKLVQISLEKTGKDISFLNQHPVLPAATGDNPAAGTPNPGRPSTGAPNPGTPGAGTSGTPKKMPFVDIDGHWAQKDIEWAYELNMVSGTSPGIFSPEAKTTEGQFLKMLLVAMNGVTEQPVSKPWTQKYYAYAAANNYPLEEINSDKPITRQAVAELIAATQGVNASGDKAIQYLLDHKLSKGKTSATVAGYHGGDNLTRAEAVRFIRNVLSAAEHQTPQPRPDK